MSEGERDIEERERERWMACCVGGEIMLTSSPKNGQETNSVEAHSRRLLKNRIKKKIVFYFHFRCGERSPLLLFNEFHIYLFFGDFLFFIFGQDIKTSASIFGCLGLRHSNRLIALLLSGFRLASGRINFQIDLQQIFCQPQNGIAH